MVYPLICTHGDADILTQRGGQHELAVDTAPLFRLATAFDELRPAI